MKKEYEPMAAHCADKDACKCFTCANRDKSSSIGAVKGNCEVYKNKMKPLEILFDNVDCEFYIKDQDKE